MKILLSILLLLLPVAAMAQGSGAAVRQLDSFSTNQTLIDPIIDGLYSATNAVLRTNGAFYGTLDGTTASLIVSNLTITGTTNLDVAGTISALNFIATNGGAGTVGLTVGTNVLVVTNKNVGIGLSSVIHKLDVRSSDGTDGISGINVLNSSAPIGTAYGLIAQAQGAATANIGGYFSASGATANYGLIVANGNVGIGTATPTSGKLVVAGSITADTDNTGGIGAAGANRFSVAHLGGGGAGTVGLTVGGSALVVTNWNVGIGTASPVNALEVSSISDKVLRLTRGGNYMEFGVDVAGANYGLGMWFNGVQQAVVYDTGLTLGSYVVAGNDAPTGGLIASGSVGIGTNAPNAKLHVLGDSNIRTNIAQFDVTITDFVIGTRYTNSNRRSFVAASFQLAAAVAGTAAVTMNVEQAGTTNKLTVSSGPLAGLTTIEPLSLLVGPGAFYYFTDTSSGGGAVASIVAGTSSQTSF